MGETSRLLQQNKELQDLLQVIAIANQQDPTGEFAARIFGGSGIVANENISMPKVIQTSSGKPQQIQVPPLLLQLYDANKSIAHAQSYLNKYEATVTKGGTGMSTANFVLSLNKILPAYIQLQPSDIRTRLEKSLQATGEEPHLAKPITFSRTEFENPPKTEKLIEDVSEIVAYIRSKTGGLGKEILLTADQVNTLQGYLKTAEPLFTSNTDLQNLHTIIHGDGASLTQGFTQALMFGEPFKINESLQEPLINRNSEGEIIDIELPPTLYILWNTQVSLDNVKKGLNSYLQYINASDEERQRLGAPIGSFYTGDIVISLIGYRLASGNLSGDIHDALAQIIPQRTTQLDWAKGGGQKPARTFEG